MKTKLNYITMFLTQLCHFFFLIFHTTSLLFLTLFVFVLTFSQLSWKRKQDWRLSRTFWLSAPFILGVKIPDLRFHCHSNLDLFNTGLLPQLFQHLHFTHTAWKWSFPLKISSVNVIKSAGNCGFGHIYWRNP